MDESLADVLKDNEKYLVVFDQIMHSVSNNEGEMAQDKWPELSIVAHAMCWLMGFDPNDPNDEDVLNFCQYVSVATYVLGRRDAVQVDDVWG